MRTMHDSFVEGWWSDIAYVDERGYNRGGHRFDSALWELVLPQFPDNTRAQAVTVQPAEFPAEHIKQLIRLVQAT